MADGAAPVDDPDLATLTRELSAPEAPAPRWHAPGCVLAGAGGLLLAADTANSRLPGFADGPAAIRLTGQPDFAAKCDNRWSPPVRDPLRRQHVLSAPGRTVAVPDSGDNCVLLRDMAK